jgi:hypothetical protein
MPLTVQAPRRPLQTNADLYRDFLLLAAALIYFRALVRFC